MYDDGMSIKEVAVRLGRSYGYARSRLLTVGVSLRSKASGTRLYVSHHPEWSQQFVKYEVTSPAALPDDKILLLTMVATEGYADSTSFGFTNTQEFLHSRFRDLVLAVYGPVLIGRNKITSRVSSTEISRNLSLLIPDERFDQSVMHLILSSHDLTVKVLRIIADTEGSVLISIRKAPSNHTVEYRIVLSSTNPHFTRQFVSLLGSLRIKSKPTPLGAIIARKIDIARFIATVGFSPEAKVVRRRGNRSVWYGAKKAGLAILFQRVSYEQSKAITTGLRGCFADCKTRDMAIQRLKIWYAEANGGDDS
jgi:hypothetical protein